MPSEKIIGALLFEGFELLDVFGPLEAWGMLAARGGWRIVTVAGAPGAISSAQRVQAVAEVALADCPACEVLLLPGGIGTRREVTNEALLEWLRRRSATATRVTSVCSGSAILARAGLLDGLRATSNKASFKWIAQQGPRVNWVKQARWVEDGRFMTSSGVSAGIDMTLAAIAQLAGPEVAEAIAIEMEYEWHRDASWDPFAKIHGLV